MIIVVVLAWILIAVIGFWLLAFAAAIIAIPFLILSGIIYTIRERNHHG